MNDSINKYEKIFNNVYNTFSNEIIGNNAIKVMPPIDRKPQIERISYDKLKDVFEIVFKYDVPKPEMTKNKGNVSFIENKNGDLLAVQISNFSSMNIGKMKIVITSSIENKIKELSLEIKQKENITANIVDKRKLQFINNVIKTDYKTIVKDNLNLTTAST